MPTRYETYPDAGQVDYAAWKDSGILVPVFDKDGTLTDANQNTLVEDVLRGMEEQDFANIYPQIGVASNNHDAEHVDEFGQMLSDRLQVEVFAISRAHGFQPKPEPEQGFAIADHFSVLPEQIGVVGDRRLTDVRFSRKMGAGAMALCDKAGEGDAKWVPELRVLERGIVYGERKLGTAQPGKVVIRL